MSRKLLLVLAVGFLLGAEGKEDALKKMQGEWQVIGLEGEGRKAAEAEVKKADYRLFINGNKFTYKIAGKDSLEGTIEINPDKNPKTLDAKGKSPDGKEEKSVGIYEIDGDTMRVCFVPEGTERPTKFETKAGSKAAIITYQRVKK
jgi:uncharacterized protein (TIGR03067 family)